MHPKFFILLFRIAWKFITTMSSFHSNELIHYSSGNLRTTKTLPKNYRTKNIRFTRTWADAVSSFESTKKMHRSKQPEEMEKTMKAPQHHVLVQTQTPQRFVCGVICMNCWVDQSLRSKLPTEQCSPKWKNPWTRQFENFAAQKHMETDRKEEEEIHLSAKVRKSVFISRRNPRIRRLCKVNKCPSLSVNSNQSSIRLTLSDWTHLAILRLNLQRSISVSISGKMDRWSRRETPFRATESLFWGNHQTEIVCAQKICITFNWIFRQTQTAPPRHEEIAYLYNRQMHKVPIILIYVNKEMSLHPYIYRSTNI